MTSLGNLLLGLGAVWLMTGKLVTMILGLEDEEERLGAMLVMARLRSQKERDWAKVGEET